MCANSKILEKAQTMFNQLPDSEMQKVGDFLEEILIDNNCVIISRQGTTVEWEMNPDHKEIKKIIKKSRGRHVTIESIDNLTDKETKRYEKRKNILSKRFAARAQRRYMISITKTDEVSTND